MNDAVPLKPNVGVKITSVPTIFTVPPTALLTALIVSNCADSLEGPTVSFASKLAKLMLRGPLSSNTLVSVSPVATGASLTAVTVTATVPMDCSGSATPLVRPLSWMV